MYLRREMRLTLPVMITVFAIMVAGAVAGDIYVDDDATYPGGGTSGDPYKRITTALAAATYADTIHVAAGLYDITNNGETFPLTMIDGVSLSGDNKDTTILDAEDAAYHVIYCDGVDNLTIEGFTIMRGIADSSSAPDHWGGGIFCNNSSPTIEDNIIIDNEATRGGAIYCDNGSEPLISGNAIKDNKGGSPAGGGGIECVYSSPTIENNTFTGNQAPGHGGAIYCYYSSPSISGNTIHGNSAGDGGGIICIGSPCSPTIEGCTITGNSADNTGGGICCEAGSSPMIRDNVIVGNSATWGGGIQSIESTPAILGNTINDNTAAGRGGGLYFESTSAAAVIDGNTITGNSGAYGGGIECAYDASPIIRSNTISGNTTTGKGGAVCCYESSPAIKDNAIQDNSAGYGGGIYCGGDSSPMIRDNVIVSNSATWGGGIQSIESTPTILSNTIKGNAAAGHGGGIYLESTGAALIEANTISGNAAAWGGAIECACNASPIIRNNAITGNTTTGNGGAVYCHESSPTIEDNIMQDNSAGYGGGIACSQSSCPEIINNLIVGNSADVNGGGIRVCSSSSPTIINCTIAGNQADADGDSSGDGGGVYSEASSNQTEVKNCILWNDIPNEIAGAGTVTVTYSDVDQAGYAGTGGNISADPKFVPTGDSPYEYYLAHKGPQAGNSPCIDVGTGTASDYGLDGMTTCTDGRDDTGTIDMGYHYPAGYTGSGDTYIELVSFEARPDGGSIVLSWETGAEIDNAGFVLFRNVAGASDYVQVSDLIPAEGRPASGASYTFKDTGVEPGVTYHYWLVDIETSGKWRVHGPASASVSFRRVFRNRTGTCSTEGVLPACLHP